ncbi:MAG: FG-GAP-like repeat-containing protein, partial [Planctomycetota bacterium]|nr:FG-GAP-like repeat-containing protein [Planctomycetota bacterium]
YEVMATVASSATAQLVNMVTVKAVNDPNSANDTATDKDNLTPLADLKIFKTDGKTTYTPGGRTIYTIVVSNLGPSAVVGAPVTDLFSALIISTSWTTVVTSGASVTPAAGAGNINSTVNLLPDATVTFTAVAQISSSATGNLVNTAKVDPPNGVVDPDWSNNTATDINTRLAPLIVLGSDNCCGLSERVLVVDPSTQLTVANFAPYGETFEGGIRVATGDLNGDGIDEIVTAPGPSGSPEVRVFTQQGIELTTFRTMAYDAAFRSGVQVAVADVDGDGKNDLITVPTRGPIEVKVFLNQWPNPVPIQKTPHWDFLAFPSSIVAGGVVAAADMGHGAPGSFTNVLDGKAEIVVGTGPGTAATVRVFDVSGADPYTPVQTFAPFADIVVNGQSFIGGVSLSVARMDSDLIPDIVVGAGTIGQSRVGVWTWATGSGTLSLRGQFAAFSGPSSPAPVRVAAMDMSGDGIAETIVAVQGSSGTTNELHTFRVTSLSPFTVVQNPPLTGFPGGYFVATITSPSVVLPLANYQNPTLSADVNNDGIASPIDALIVINFVNLGQPLPPAPVPPTQPQYYWDVDGNNVVTASDVLQIINLLDSQSIPAGEGEYVAAATPDAPVATASAAPATETLVLLPGLPNISWRVAFPESPSALIDRLPPTATAYAGRLDNPQAQLANAVPPRSATARSADSLFDLLGADDGRSAESGLDDVLTDIAGDVQAAQDGQTAEDWVLGG